MKIDIEILKAYITKVSLNGIIFNMNMNFTDKGVTTVVKDTSQTAMVLGLLKSEAFENYKSIGEIFIKNSKMLIELLKTFSGTVELVKTDDNILQISNDIRNVNMLLAEKKICSNIYDEDKPIINTTVELQLDKSVLTRTVCDMNLLDINNAVFEKVGKELKITVGTKNEYDFIENIVMFEDNEDHVKVGVGAMFAEVVNSLGNTIKIKLGSNLPLIFIDEDDDMFVETIIAPFIKGDD